MSDTPRTDAAWYASEGGAGCEPLLKCSLQLERKLALLRRKVAAAEGMAEALREIQKGKQSKHRSDLAAFMDMRQHAQDAIAAWQEANK